MQAGDKTLATKAAPGPFLNAVRRNLELAGANVGIRVNVVDRINVSNCENDPEFAAMIGEATKGFSVEELMRLSRRSPKAISKAVTRGPKAGP